MQVQPYIFFEGKCEEAINFYKTALNAEVVMLMRYKDNPEPQASGDGCGPGMSSIKPESVMHATLKIGGTDVMMSDGMASGKPEFKGITLSLNPATEAEAKKLFEALGVGGQVQMPMAKTFFSPCFGMVADRFGVSWMIVVPGDMPAR
ncbi:MAG: VOC family metalloprotein YjdN [Polaromonas sp.]|uniref:VOC family metalloprotein YjdN n=1 Tax=Polaromonas sp. TaxID=1869339 RepID=UPI0025F478B6|nr:VOC family metalloprotein YjdN [Polaromonas sp.]MBI2725664.1 VOC family metalloprotein YjdN [Polaromonas sp.]